MAEFPARNTLANLNSPAFRKRLKHLHFHVQRVTDLSSLEPRITLLIVHATSIVLPVGAGILVSRSLDRTSVKRWNITGAFQEL